MNSTPAVKAILFDFVGILLCRRPDYRPAPLIETIDAVIGRVVDDQQFKADILRDYALSAAEFESVLQAIVDKYVPFVPLWELLPELKSHYQLAIINNVSKAMSSQLDVDAIIKTVGDQVRETFQVEVANIYLYDSSSQMIHLPYSYDRQYVATPPFPLGEGLTSKVILSRQPLILGSGPWQPYFADHLLVEEA